MFSIEGWSFDLEVVRQVESFAWLIIMIISSNKIFFSEAISRYRLRTHNHHFSPSKGHNSKKESLYKFDPIKTFDGLIMRTCILLIGSFFYYGFQDIC